jgi:hypothetical protein
MNNESSVLNHQRRPERPPEVRGEDRAPEQHEDKAEESNRNGGSLHAAWFPQKRL